VGLFDSPARRQTSVQRLSRVSRSDACAFAFGKKIMVVGGFTGTTVNSSTEIFDADDNTWTEGPSLSAPRSGCKAVVLDNTAYVIGGFDGQSRLSSVEALNLDFPLRWEPRASLNVQVRRRRPRVSRSRPNATRPSCSRGPTLGPPRARDASWSGAGSTARA
jgi:hypothetical protein